MDPRHRRKLKRLLHCSGGVTADLFSCRFIPPEQLRVRVIVPITTDLFHPDLAHSMHPKNGVLFYLHQEDSKDIQKRKRQWIRDEQTKHQTASNCMKIQLEAVTCMRTTQSFMCSVVRKS